MLQSTTIDPERRSPGCKTGLHEPDPERSIVSEARPPADEYEYDVVLSFAGEDRPYVKEVARLLHELGVRIFYDKYEAADLWGKDLYAHLDEIYRNRSRYCVMFVSCHYKDKVWPSHERASAQARALNSSADYVLPVRFDDTEIPGLRPTIGYLDLREIAPDELAFIVLEKLGLSRDVNDLISYLESRLDGYKITVDGTWLHFSSEQESFEADYPIRLMLEMYRADMLEKMFIMPAIVPW